MIPVFKKQMNLYARGTLFYVLWVLFPIAATCGHWAAFFTEKAAIEARSVSQNTQHLRVYVDTWAKRLQSGDSLAALPQIDVLAFQTLDVFVVTKESKFATRPRFAHEGDYLAKTPLVYAAEQTADTVTGRDISYRFISCLRAVKRVEVAGAECFLVAELDWREADGFAGYFIWDEILSLICSLGFVAVGLWVFRPYVLTAESPDKNLQAVLATLETVSKSFNAAELRQAFRAMPFSAVILDEDLRIMFLSDAAALAFGTAEGAAVNVPFDVFIPDQCRENYWNEVRGFVKKVDNNATFAVDWPPGFKTVTLSKVKSATRTLVIVVLT